MQITEVVFHKVSITDTELGSDMYAQYGGRSPYYRDPLGNWYITDTEDNYIYYITTCYITRLLEQNYKEMHPFKGQMELF